LYDLPAGEGLCALHLEWFEADGELSSSIVEGFNNKVKQTMRKAYGYKSSNLPKISLYHTLGDLQLA